MQKSFGVAIVGCGRIARHHAVSITQTEGLKLAAVCDLDQDRSVALAQEFCVPSFADFHLMLKQNPNIDAVALMTPSGMHFEHATEILSQYSKHLIIEKPTFLRMGDFANIRALADKKKKNIWPVFQNRYNLAVQRVKSALSNNELGELRLLSVRVRWCRPQRYYDLSAWRGTFAQDGGALTNQGVHHVDLIRHLGGEVKSLSCSMATLGAEIEVEDTAVAQFRFANGGLGNLEVTTSARPDDFEASISIVGAKGLAQIGGIAVNELQVFTPDPDQCKMHSEDFSGNVYGHGHKKVYQQIVSELKNGMSSSPGSLNEAEKTIELLHAFYDSAVIGQTVNVSDRRQVNRLGETREDLANLYRLGSAEKMKDVG
jgi:UDP-N-acetyl-2-amino-2-deoxyglucuronate dehydrogenase